MQGAASHIADEEDPSNISTARITSPSMVSVSNADADIGAGLVPDYPPGVRSLSGRQTEPEDIRTVISLLKEAGIPACIVGVYALRYYGAGRISNVSYVPA